MRFSGRKGAAGKKGKGKHDFSTSLLLLPLRHGGFTAAFGYEILFLEFYSQPAKLVPIISFGRSRLFGVSVVKREFTRYCAKKE